MTDLTGIRSASHPKRDAPAMAAIAEIAMRRLMAAWVEKPTACWA